MPLKEGYASPICGYRGSAEVAGGRGGDQVGLLSGPGQSLHIHKIQSGACIAGFVVGFRIPDFNPKPSTLCSSEPEGLRSTYES